jgi:hypothetical protein
MKGNSDHTAHFSSLIVETLKTVNIEDDETVPHSDYVTIGLVGKYPEIFW